tara:strand:- start:430 stop:816 length:387 start_codon:yes stop_codon:yes gene_type:complete
MKLNHFYKFSFILVFITFVLFTNFLLAENVADKVKKLSLKLRCMTCQNQSVYDSDSDFAKDIMKIIEDKFNEGKTEKEIILLLSDRYGEYILFEPLLNKRNIFLWLFPFTLLFISIVFFIYYVKKKKF